MLHDEMALKIAESMYEGKFILLSRHAVSSMVSKFSFLSRHAVSSTFAIGILLT